MGSEYMCDVCGAKFTGENAAAEADQHLVSFHPAEGGVTETPQRPQSNQPSALAKERSPASPDAQAGDSVPDPEAQGAASDDLEGLKKDALVAEAASLGIRGRTGMKKPELVAAIREARSSQ
jgi:hypothetical protein